MREKETIKKLDYLTQEQKEKVNDYAKNDRDSLIIELLYELGCSQNELIKIKVSDINFRENKILIHSGKKSARASSISQKTTDMLNRYISKNKFSTHDFLLLTRQSQTMTTKRVRQIVQEALKKSLGNEIKNPKILRYTHIVHAYLKNIPLLAIERQTGLTRSRMIQLFREIDIKKADYYYTNFLNK